MRKFLVLGLILGLLTISFAVAPVAAQNCYADTANVLKNGDSGVVAQSYSSLRDGVGSAAVKDIRYGGETFVVTGEPQCWGAHWWIPVRYDSDGAEGWATEGYHGSYWLAPVSNGGTDGSVDPVSGVTYYPPTGAACEGAPTPRLTIGQHAEVAQSYSTLRKGIHSYQIIRVIGPGEDLTVNDGPYCTDLGPYNWYQVTDSQGNQGWVTEGTGSTYWLKPASE